MTPALLVPGRYTHSHCKFILSALSSAQQGLGCDVGMGMLRHVCSEALLVHCLTLPLVHCLCLSLSWQLRCAVRQILTISPICLLIAPRSGSAAPVSAVLKSLAACLSRTSCLESPILIFFSASVCCLSLRPHAAHYS